MYILVSCIGVPKGFNQRWSTIGLTNVSMKHLYDTYRTLWLTLRVNPDAQESYLDLSLIQSTYAQSSLTVEQFLTVNGNASLPVVGSRPVIETKYVKYGDAHMLRYHINPVHPQYGTNVDMGSRSALMLTKDDTQLSYTSFLKNAIVSVNGFWHLCDTDGTNGVMVYEGGRTYQKTKLNQCGILSFSALGGIECLPIRASMVHKRLTPEMINGAQAIEPYSRAAYLSVDRDLAGKTVLLVLGGYLHGADSDIFQRVGDREYMINFNAYPMIDRYYESSQYLDLSALGLSVAPTNKSQIDVAQLHSDEVLLKYMTLSQSYLVIVNTPELFTQRKYIRKTGRPGTYIAYEKPEFPIVTGIGRTPEYWYREEPNGAWALWAYNDMVRPRIYSTTNPHGLSALSSAATTTPIDPEIQNGVYFMAMGTDLKKV